MDDNQPSYDSVLDNNDTKLNKVLTINIKGCPNLKLVGGVDISYYINKDYTPSKLIIYHLENCQKLQYFGNASKYLSKYERYAKSNRVLTINIKDCPNLKFICGVDISKNRKRFKNHTNINGTESFYIYDNCIHINMKT